MARKSTTDIAVMGLLALGARTGYDVRRDCEEKLSHFWSESFGQIYPALKRLHERGWVERQPVEGAGATRYEHALTDEGRKALRDWVASPPQPLLVRNELLLKLFLGRMVDREEIRALLRDHAEKAHQRREQLLGLQALVAAEADARDADLWLVTLDYGVRSLEAQGEWVAAALEALSEHAADGDDS